MESALLARTGRHRQRYEDHYRLVAGVSGLRSTWRLTDVPAYARDAWDRHTTSCLWTLRLEGNSRIFYTVERHLDRVHDDAISLGLCWDDIKQTMGHHYNSV